MNKDKKSKSLKIFTQKKAKFEPVGSYYHPTEHTYRTNTCPIGYELKEGYNRKSYTTKKGTKIPKTHVGTTCIKDRGLPGKVLDEYKVITISNKNKLSEHGYSIKKSENARYRALLKAIEAYGYLSVLRKLVALRTLTRDSNPEQSQIHDIDIKKLQTWRKSNPELNKNIKMKGGGIDDKYNEIKGQLKENTPYLFSVLWGGGSMSLPVPLYISFFATVKKYYGSIVFYFSNLQGQTITVDQSYPVVYGGACYSDYHCVSRRILADRFNGGIAHVSSGSSNIRTMTLYSPSLYLSSRIGKGSKLFFNNLKFIKADSIKIGNNKITNLQTLPRDMSSTMNQTIKELYGSDYDDKYSHQNVWQSKNTYSSVNSTGSGAINAIFAVVTLGTVS